MRSAPRKKDKNMTHDNRLRAVPADLVVIVSYYIDRMGAARACDRFGTHRATLLAIAAGRPVMPGSLALLREANRRRSPWWP